MSVNPVNSGSNYVSQVQPQPQSAAERAAQKDSEEARKKAAAVARTSVPVQPAVNTSNPNPKAGSVINVQA
jgi:hypothetical protein